MKLYRPPWIMAVVGLASLVAGVVVAPASAHAASATPFTCDARYSWCDNFASATSSGLGPQWAGSTHQDSGGAVATTGTSVALSSGGNEFPFFHPATAPIPASGDFKIDVSAAWPTLGGAGTDVALVSRLPMDPTDEGSADATIVGNLHADRNLQEFSAGSCSAVISDPTNYHTYEWSYFGSNVSLSIDGALQSTCSLSTPRPTQFFVGNPVAPATDWTTISLQYIYVVGATVLVPFESAGWSYLDVGPAEAPANFQAPSFNDSSWLVGQAGFGTTDGRCAWNNTSQVHTAWKIGNEMLLRKHFTLPAGATGLHISGSVDNTALVYVNGTRVASADNGNCQSDGIEADIPSSAFMAGDNVLAVDAGDYGDSDYIDVQVTYTQSGDQGGGAVSGLSVTPTQGTVTTPFTAMMSCTSGSTPSIAFFVTRPDGSRLDLKEGPSLVIESNILTTGSYSRIVTFKTGPDLALAQANGKVSVQGRCSGQSNSTAVQTISIAQTSFTVVGDSYSSGEGNQTFASDTDLNPSGSTATGCHRSNSGWAYKVAAARGYVNPPPTYEPTTWTFAACSGADLPDLTKVNKTYAKYGEKEVAQLNAITSSTKTVALTDGGNDVGFAKILQGCLVGPSQRTSAGCGEKGDSIRKDTEKALKKLPNDLTDAYTAIVGRMAPDGVLYVAGYPHLFGANKSNYTGSVYNSGFTKSVPACNVSGSLAIGYADAQWINAATDQGDQIIAQSVANVNNQLAAAHSQRRVVFAGNNAGQEGAVGTFASHGLCDAQPSYINGLYIDAVHLGPFQTSFHPNVNGQIAYARAFEAAMGLPLTQF